MHVGFDMVLVNHIQASVAAFGERFLRKIYTPQELDYCGHGAALKLERLASRFAAKEAVIKALRLAEAGVRWSDIEVVKLRDGACAIACHGRVAEVVRDLGVQEISVSMSHEADYAGACVVVQCA